MMILAYLLIRSVRAVIQRKVFPVNNSISVTAGHRISLQNMDARLTLMLILQSIIVVITFIPFATDLIYTNITGNWPKSALRVAQEKLFTESSHLMSYLFFASSFYVSMISNTAFRRHIKNFFKYSQPNERKFHTNLTQPAIDIRVIQRK